MAWSEAFDGYDPRRAPRPKLRFMRVVHKVSGSVRVGTSVTMVVSLVCSAAVPLLACRGGSWAAAAALAVLLGQAADAMTNGQAVHCGPVSRLAHFYQAVVQRFAELCWLVSLVVLGARPAPVMLCAFVVWAHEYLRAKAGGAAMRRAGTATVGDRPLRVWLVVVALLLAAVTSPIGRDVAAGVVTMVVLCWVALGLIGLARLFTIIRRALT